MGARPRPAQALRAAASWCAIALFAVLCGAGMAAQEKYDYDPTGRLVRFTDSNKEVTEYTYDKAGNITAVARGGPGSGLPPTITTAEPSFVRRGQTATLVLKGERLERVGLRASDAGLVISDLRLSATQVQATLAVGASVGLGTQTVTVTDSRGSARMSLQVAPVLPTLALEPAPLALPPDNTQRFVTLRLSTADAVPHQLALVLSDSSKATLATTALTLAVGQTSALVGLTPKASGFTNLSITSPTLKTLVVPVFITSDFRGVNTSQAQPLGVRVGEVEASVPPTTSGTFKVNSVGLVVGSVLTAVSPRGVAAGGSYALALQGRGLPAGARVAVVPGEGVLVGSLSVAPTQISATLSIDPAATAGVRLVVVTDAAGVPVPFADPALSTLQITTGQPQLVSIDPLFGTPNSLLRLHIRGTHLQGAKVRILPAVDVAVDTDPVVSADGSELTVPLSIRALAAPGPRTVQVVTPSGSSDAAPSAANQFTIVSATREAVTPITASLLGVLVGASTGPGTTSTVGPFAAGVLGVTVGAAAYELAPRVAVIGTSVEVRVRGAGLQAVTSVSLVPPQGVAIGAVQASPAGGELVVPLTVDSTAALGARQLVLRTASGRLPFANADGDQVLVSTPAPELLSVAPQALATGKTVTLTLRGSNFNNVSGIRFEPPDGMVAVPPYTVSQDARVIQFELRVATDAPAGQRTVIVTTAGGPSSSMPAPANTLVVGRQLGPVREAISSPLLGLRVGSAAAQDRQDVGLYAASVGVTLSAPDTAVTEQRDARAPQLGVLVGPAPQTLVPHAPDGLVKGATGVLQISGIGLGSVTRVAVTGPGALVLGTWQASADGTRLTVPVTVPADALSTYYGIRLSTGAGTTGTRLSALAENDLLFRVGAAPTRVDSLAPIILERGKTYTLTVRGAGLADVYRVFAEPGVGLRFDEGAGGVQAGSDAFGEKLTVPVRVLPDAPLGSHAVRLAVPGATTAAEPTPANTITVVSPQ